MVEFNAGFKRMIGDFGTSRVDQAVTRAIDNVPDFVPTLATIRQYVPAMNSKDKFQACEQNGCDDGWHHVKDKAGNKAVIRCQCFHDWVARAS